MAVRDTRNVMYSFNIWARPHEQLDYMRPVLEAAFKGSLEQFQVLTLDRRLAGIVNEKAANFCGARPWGETSETWKTLVSANDFICEESPGHPEHDRNSN